MLYFVIHEFHAVALRVYSVILFVACLDTELVDQNLEFAVGLVRVETATVVDVRAGQGSGLFLGIGVCVLELDSFGELGI